MEGYDSIVLDFGGYEEPIVEEEWKGNTIKIKKYISEGDQVFLYKTYVDIYFENTDPATRYLSANYSMVLAVINLCTNINTQDLVLSDVISSGLWALIRKNIVNYNYVMKDIEKLAEMISKEKQIASGLGFALESVVAKVVSAIENSNITDDNIKESVGKLLEGIEALRETGVVYPKEILP